MRLSFIGNFGGLGRFEASLDDADIPGTTLSKNSVTVGGTPNPMSAFLMLGVVGIVIAMMNSSRPTRGTIR